MHKREKRRESIHMHALVGEEEHTPRKRKNIRKHIMCLENHTSLAGSKILWRSREKRGNGGRRGIDFFFFLKANYFIMLYWFCHTLTSTCHSVHVFPILNPPPTSLPIPSLWVIQCTSPEHPVSCIEPGLAIHFTYDNIHVSMPFSQIIPPSPSPTESKRLLYTSVSLLLSRIQGYCYHLSKFYTYVSVYCIGVFLSGLLHSV